MSSFVDYSIGWSSNVLGNRPIFFPRGTLTLRKNWGKRERERNSFLPLRFLPVCLLLLFWKEFLPRFFPVLRCFFLLISCPLFPLFPEFLRKIAKRTREIRLRDRFWIERCAERCLRAEILSELSFNNKSTFKSEFFYLLIVGCFVDYRGQECTYIFCC